MENKLLIRQSLISYKRQRHSLCRTGNVRSVFRTTATGNTPTVVQETNYYAFGSEIAALSWSDATITQKNKYLYNGKEKQTVDNNDVAFCMDWLDYGARFYDAWGVRFWSIDPLAEKYNFQSGYVYAANNPIRFIDWMGMAAEDYFYFDSKGNLVDYKKEKGPDRFFVQTGLKIDNSSNMPEPIWTEAKVNYSEKDIQQLWINSNPENPNIIERKEQSAAIVLDLKNLSIEDF